MPKVSIIIPVYNVEQWIRESIESSINQTYKNLEIIIVDDGSTDNSGIICDEYADKDIRITVIHKKNGGLVSARKAGLKVATGEYICFLDSDDTIELSMIEEVSALLQESSADYAVFGYIEEGARTSYISPCHENKIINVYENLEKIFDSLILSINNEFCMIRAICSKMFRRNIIIPAYNKLPDRCSQGEDYITTAETLFCTNKILLINQCYYHYRIRDNSYTTTKNLQTLSNIAFMHSQLATVFENHDYYEKVKDKLNFEFMREIRFKCGDMCADVGKYYREAFFFLRNKKIVFFGNNKDIERIESSLLINEEYKFINIYQNENTIDLGKALRYINENKNKKEIYLFISSAYNQISNYLTQYGLREKYDYMNAEILL